MNEVEATSFEKRKIVSLIQVLQVHSTSFIEGEEDDYPADGSIYISHGLFTHVLQQPQTRCKNIDALMVGPDCSIADIILIREVATQKMIPLIFHTLKYDWKSKEIAIESGVDEYHIGSLDQSFVKRIKLIKQVKSQTIGNSGRKQRDGSPTIKFWFLKRIFDISISLLIMLMLLPALFIILPLLIVETNGLVLRSSKRVGKNYRIFELYSFRCASSALGHFLHDTRLDGLPQILNVLAGDMSLIGNCPIAVQDAEKLTKDGVAWRFFAPAGIIGLWWFNHAEESTTGAGDITKLDIEYAKTNSIWLDIRILCVHFLNLVVKRRNWKEREWILRHLSMEMLISDYISKERGNFNVATN